MVKFKVGRPSAVEVSSHRKEIEEMLREGKSADFISNWLKSVGVCISRSAIYRYKKNKFNIQAEAIQKYNNEKSKERLNRASDDVVSDIKYLDSIIDLANDIKLEHDSLVASDDGFDELAIEKHKLNIKKLGIQATRVRAGILKDSDDGEDKEFTIRFVSDSNENDRVEADRKAKS